MKFSFGNSIALAAAIFIGCKNETSNREGLQKQSIAQKPTAKQTEISHITEFVFGKFCSECHSNCAPMFRVFTKGNIMTVSADYDDNYFNNKKFDFKTHLTSAKSVNIANEIIWKLPEALVLNKSNKVQYGCPDCTDGCGIYIRFSTEGNREKEYYLDLHDTDSKKPIPKEIQSYAQFVESKIESLIKK